MVDPDAPTPQNATSRFILHWLQSNMTQTDTTSSKLSGRELTNATDAFVPYANPAPPTDSDAHRYILYAFVQASNFTIPEAFQDFSSTNRSSFNLTQFIADAGLGTPAAAQYFYVSNQTGVPDDFIALPGGNYSDAVSSSATSTASSTAASATSSGSASDGARVVGMSCSSGFTHSILGAGLLGLLFALL